MEKLLSVKEVSRLLGLSARTIRRLCDSGLMESYRIGTRTRRISRTQVQVYLESCSGYIPKVVDVTTLKMEHTTNRSLKTKYSNDDRSVESITKDILRLCQ